MLHYSTYFVVGMGKSGMAAARFLKARGAVVLAFDSRPTKIDGITVQNTPQVPAAAQCIVISPGVDPHQPWLRQAGVPIISDVQLFCAEAKAPIIAITGSNGKSSITTLVGQMATACGLNARVGGNLGTPATELLADDADIYVLELSSFQLECLYNLNATVAAWLNLCPDHLDRHGNMTNYAAAKARIFAGATSVVLGDALYDDYAPLLSDKNLWRVYFNSADNGTDIFDYRNGKFYHQNQIIIDAPLKIMGAHQMQNVLAAFAIGRAAGFDVGAMARAVMDFGGLPHRCQWVKHTLGMDFFDDSKGTNVGASLAAVRGLGAVYGDNSLAVILGGVGKGQDFCELLPDLKKYARWVLLIGQDGGKIAQDLAPLDCQFCQDLDGALAFILANDKPKAVLLSPACASFDQFANYEARGQAFCSKVNAL